MSMEEKIFLARVAEQAERFEDMVQFLEEAIGAIEQNPKYQKFGDALGTYKKKIEGELYDKCMKIVNIVQNQCVGLAAEDESKAFFQKMIGDYYRYVAESASADKLETVK